MKVLLFVVASLVMIQASKPEYFADYRSNVGKGILDSVQEVIYDLLQNATNLLTTLRTALTNVLESAFRLLTGLIKDAENLLASVADEILQQIHHVEQVHLPCVANQEENVKKIVGVGRQDIRTCINTAFEAIEDVHNRTNSFETDIGNEIGKIKQLLSQCYSINPLEIVKCVIDQVNEIGQSLSDIAYLAKQAIKLAATEVDQIVEDTRSCVDTVIDGVRKQIDGISKQIVNCIESEKPK